MTRSSNCLEHEYIHLVLCTEAQNQVGGIFVESCIFGHAVDFACGREDNPLVVLCGPFDDLQVGLEIN